MNDELMTVLSRVGTTQLALESLRANSTAQALEFLEMDLDASVLALNRLANEIDPTQRERVISTLRQIRAYRRVNPRHTEADLGTIANGVVARAAREAQQRVCKILDEIK